MSRAPRYSQSAKPIFSKTAYQAGGKHGPAKPKICDQPLCGDQETCGSWAYSWLTCCVILVIVTASACGSAPEIAIDLTWAGDTPSFSETVYFQARVQQVASGLQLLTMAETERVVYQPGGPVQLPGFLPRHNLVLVAEILRGPSAEAPVIYRGESVPFDLSTGTTSRVKVQLESVLGRGRRQDDLVVSYGFVGRVPNRVLDLSLAGAPMDLTIVDPNAIEWIDGGGLRLVGATEIETRPATKLHERLGNVEALTVEAWLMTADATATAPIIAYGDDPADPRFALAQQAGNARATIRPGPPGSAPVSLVVPAPADADLLQHWIAVYDDQHGLRLYVDGDHGTSVAPTTGSLADWSAPATFALANGIDGKSPWNGALMLVAVYSASLPEGDVLRNYAAKPGLP